MSSIVYRGLWRCCGTRLTCTVSCQAKVRSVQHFAVRSLTSSTCATSRKNIIDDARTIRESHSTHEAVSEQLDYDGGSIEKLILESAPIGDELDELTSPLTIEVPTFYEDETLVDHPPEQIVLDSWRDATEHLMDVEESLRLGVDILQSATSGNIADDQTFEIDQMFTDSAPSGEVSKEEASPRVDEQESEETAEEEYGEEEELSDDDVQIQILNVALEYVPQFGWSEQAISEAVKALDLSEACSGMFKQGSADLVLHFIEESNLKLSDYLEEESRKRRLEGDGSLAGFDRGAFIENAIQVRLRMIIPYIDTWSQALTQLAHPNIASDAFESAAHMMDEIWFYAGDTSTDMNWYTKRGALAAIYASTELYMLGDSSTDFSATWSFLHRRMEEAKAANIAKQSIQNCASDLQALAAAAFTTVQNLAGLNNRRR